jgi:transposase
MQTRRDESQCEMMLLPSLEDRIPDDYYLRRIKRVLNLSFVHDMVRPLYCQDNGRPSIDPEVVIRLFILQAITGTGSVRQLLREADLHLGYRWFIGYGVSEALPDHSSLSRALSRFGDDVFNEIFKRSIAQCRASGVIEGRILHIDATTIRADLDRDRVNKFDSPDPDARFGHFPDGTMQPGFKQQTVVDDRSRVVLAIDVLPANASEGSSVVNVLDEAVQRLEESPEVVCADSAYASGKNRSECESRGVRLVSPPRIPRNQHSRRYFGIERFSYDELRDVFVCPAGKLLRRAGRGGVKPDRWKYLASAKDCGVCPLKSQCTKAPQRGLNVSGKHAALVRLRADSQCADFQALYRKRAPVIEGVFAEAKQWHGLDRAWWRGLRKVRVQCLLVASALNLKRLASGVRSAGDGLRHMLLNRQVLRSTWRTLHALFARMPWRLAFSYSATVDAYRGVAG